MSFILNTKQKIPSEKETRTKILTLAAGRGCYEEAKRVFDKYESIGKNYIMDERARFQIAKNLIQSLADIDIYLITWLANEQGQIAIGNTIAFEIEDVPERN